MKLFHGTPRLFASAQADATPLRRNSSGIVVKRPTRVGSAAAGRNTWPDVLRWNYAMKITQRRPVAGPVEGRQQDEGEEGGAAPAFRR